VVDFLLAFLKNFMYDWVRPPPTFLAWPVAPPPDTQRDKRKFQVHNISKMQICRWSYLNSRIRFASRHFRLRSGPKTVRNWYKHNILSSIQVMRKNRCKNIQKVYFGESDSGPDLRIFKTRIGNSSCNIERYIVLS
jgi:hypothetical protein